MNVMSRPKRFVLPEVNCMSLLPACPFTCKNRSPTSKYTNIGHPFQIPGATTTNYFIPLSGRKFVISDTLFSH